MHANAREDREEIGAGEIAAAVGLKQTTTGNTLCDEGHPVLLESIVFPEPVISQAVEPKTKADQDKLARRSAASPRRIPTFRVRTDEETGQTVISGMGELHLEIIVDRLIREFNVGATVGKPQVAYRETVRKLVEKVVRQVRAPDRRPRPVRPCRHLARAERAGQGLRVRQQDQRRRDPARVHLVGRCRHQGGDGGGRGRRLPRRRLQGHADIRLVP